MKTRIDDYEYIYINHRKGSGFNLTIEPSDSPPAPPEQEIFIDYATAKKLVDYIRDAWREIDEELLKVICGEGK